jgi:ABC-type nitrate/sulfonate/bicarbonate transport system substrate-binding protein
MITLGVSKKTLPHFKVAADLRGKKIGVTAPGSSTSMIASFYLAKHGLKPTDVSFIGVGAGAGAIYDQVNQDISVTELANRILMDAQDGWRTNGMKIRILRNELLDCFNDEVLVDQIIEVAKYYENY